MQENKLLELISEKVLEEKIKFLVWNSKIDLIIICYLKSYELQRLGFKHEEIFKKQEKCEILDIKFIEEKEIIAVFLEDRTINFIDYSNGALILNHKFSKNTNILQNKGIDLYRRESKSSTNIFLGLSESQNYFSNLSNNFWTEQFIVNEEKIKLKLLDSNEKNILQDNFNFSIEEKNKRNPFFKDLIFNSFAKIDISYLNFINNKLNLTPTLTFDKKKNDFEIELSLGFLIKIACLKFNNFSPKNTDETEEEKEIFDIKFLEKENFFFIEKQTQKNSDEILLNLKFLNMNLLSNSYRNITFLCYLIFDSIQIINYINNILGIFNKTFYKLGEIFDDEFKFANNLEYADNTEDLKVLLNKQLKILFYLGNYNDDEKFKNFMHKYLFEGNSLNKLDEKIHFNLKNIEDILIENIKPCINTLIYNHSQIKILNSDLEYYGNIQTNEKNNNFIKEEITANNKQPLNNNQNEENMNKSFELSEKIDYICENIFNRYEEFLIQINEVKINYRNFLSWIYSFNPVFRDREKINDNNINTKTVLNTLPINYNQLFYFLNDSNYNMNNLISFIERHQISNLTEEEKANLNSVNKYSVDSYERYLYRDKFFYNIDKTPSYTESKIKAGLLNKINFKIFKNVNFKNIFLSKDSKQEHVKEIESTLKNSKIYATINEELLFQKFIAENKYSYSMDLENSEEKDKFKFNFKDDSDSLENFQMQNLNKKKAKQEIKDSTIKTLLNKLKEYYHSLNSMTISNVSNQISIKNFLRIKGLSQKNTKKISWIDENPNFFPYFSERDHYHTQDSKKLTYFEKILYIWYFDINQNHFNIVLLHFIFKVNSKKEYSLNEDMHFKYNQKNIKVDRVSYLKFPINMKNIDIIDFCLHKNKNLLFLVKSTDEIINNPKSNENISILQNEKTKFQNTFNSKSPEKFETLNNNNVISSKSSVNALFQTRNFRHTLIRSDISNYSFENLYTSDKGFDIEINDGCIELEVNQLNKTDIIKIDSLLDVDCSENTYISPGKRSFISLIDAKKNKISIIDI